MGASWVRSPRGTTTTEQCRHRGAVSAAVPGCPPPATTLPSPVWARGIVRALGTAGCFQQHPQPHALPQPLPEVQTPNALNAPVLWGGSGGCSGDG